MIDNSLLSKAMKSYLAATFVVATAITLASCTIPARTSPTETSPAPSSTVPPSSTYTITPSPTPTFTPTPAATETPTITPTSIDPWGNYPGPSQKSAIEIPREMPLIEFSTNTVNVILLGSDQRSGRGGYRTDTMMIVSLNVDDGTATLLSIPRDLYVYIPGWRVDRINTAEPRGHFEMLADTVRYNLGIDLDHWVRMEFGGFVEAVDLLEGIEVRSTGHLYDESGGVFYSYEPGNVYPMDGSTALCYARMRKRSSDFDRLRRQQEIVLAFFDKVISINGLERVPELFDTFSYSLETDMTLGDVSPLVPLASILAQDLSRIHSFSIDRSMAVGWRVPSSGASVQLPQRENIQAMLQEAFSPDQNPTQTP